MFCRKERHSRKDNRQYRKEGRLWHGFDGMGTRFGFFEKDGEWDIVFPNTRTWNEMFNPPVFSKNGRYIAVAEGEKIYAYDTQNDTLLECPGRFHNVLRSLRFDSLDRIYYRDRNCIGRWDVAAQKIETLYTLSRAVHGPESLGISPDCRYVSFCKYRSSDYRLHIYDTESNQCTDMKRALYHYIWLDKTHIIWTWGSGLHLLNVESGKSVALVKDWKHLYKKSSRQDAALLEPFCGKARGAVSTKADVLGVQNDRIYFSLWVVHYYREGDDFHGELKSVHHKGIWSIGRDGSDPAFCYEKPSQYMKATYKGFMEDGSIWWTDPEGLHIFNGEHIEKIDAPCRPVEYYGMRSR